MKHKVIGIIPARYGSSRFPGKPLIKIGSKSMIHWTYQSSSNCKSLDDIIVATDDDRIFQEVQSFGGKAMMTRTDHVSGTDRLIEVVQSLDKNVDITNHVIVNIQGDEPGIESELIEGVVQLKLKEPSWAMTTAAVPMSYEEAKDPNRVKVIFTHDYQAIYFSRSIIPYALKQQNLYYRHLGIYCYEIDFLKKYNSLPESKLESSESLEQLRAIEAGYSIGIHLANKASLSIDHPEDVALVEEDFKSRGWI